VNVAGQGYLAELCREFIDILKPLQTMRDVNFTSCFPRPHAPDFKKYKLIFLLILASWLMLLFEPYALRLKYIIMEHYYPEVAFYRTLWLYNDIMRKRTNIITFARRKYYGKNFVNEEMTFVDVLRSKASR
jgi:hypothetical protein